MGSFATGPARTVHRSFRIIGKEKGKKGEKEGLKKGKSGIKLRVRLSPLILRFKARQKREGEKDKMRKIIQFPYAAA